MSYSTLCPPSPKNLFSPNNKNTLEKYKLDHMVYYMNSPMTLKPQNLPQGIKDLAPTDLFQSLSDFSPSYFLDPNVKPFLCPEHAQLVSTSGSMHWLFDSVWNPQPPVCTGLELLHRVLARVSPPHRLSSLSLIP